MHREFAIGLQRVRLIMWTPESENTGSPEKEIERELNSEYAQILHNCKFCMLTLQLCGILLGYTKLKIFLPKKWPGYLFWNGWLRGWKKMVYVIYCDKSSRSIWKWVSLKSSGLGKHLLIAAILEPALFIRNWPNFSPLATLPFEKTISFSSGHS